MNAKKRVYQLLIVKVFHLKLEQKDAYDTNQVIKQIGLTIEIMIFTHKHLKRHQKFQTHVHIRIEKVRI